MIKPCTASMIAAILALHGVASAAGPADATAGAAPTPKVVKTSPEAIAVPASYSAEILVLHANNGHRGIDPRIGVMPELQKIPFSAYKSYALVQKAKLPLKPGDAQTFDLPNGRVLQAKLIDVLPHDTVRLSASIDQPGGKTFLPLLEVKASIGQPFIVAGQSYRSGILVLVIRVVK